MKFGGKRRPRESLFRPAASLVWSRSFGRYSLRRDPTPTSSVSKASKGDQSDSNEWFSSFKVKQLGSNVSDFQVSG